VVEDLILADIEVDNQTLVVEDPILADIEVDNQTLVVEDPILEDTEVVENLNILKKEILNLLELENLNPQAAIKKGKKQIIKAEEKITTVQTARVVKNKTKLSFIKQ
jgi:hypothetical protein